MCAYCCGNVFESRVATRVIDCGPYAILFNSMTQILLFIVGLLLIIWIFRDILLTTYSMEGGGEMTDFFMKKSWQLLLWISGNDGRHSFLSFSGMFMMIGLILLWSLGLWLGVFLLFASNPGSIINSNTFVATNLWEKLHFSGYVLTTMGLGDYMPKNATWGIISTIFSFFGLLFITLMVSYAVPVLSNIITKKQLSLFIQQLGTTPVELLIYLWDGKSFSGLKDIRQELQQRILTIAQSHKAYPILHYFHSNRKDEALVITLCIVDETLTLLLERVPADQWDEKEVLPLRKALDHYLETMKTTYGQSEEASHKAPAPNLGPLVEANIKLTEKKQINHKRKNLWSALLQSQGWTWKEIYPDGEMPAE